MAPDRGILSDDRTCLAVSGNPYGVCLNTVAARRNRECRVVRYSGLLAMTGRQGLALNSKGDNMFFHLVIASDRRERGNLVRDSRDPINSFETDASRDQRESSFHRA